MSADEGTTSLVLANLEKLDGARFHVGDPQTTAYFGLEDPNHGLRQYQGDGEGNFVTVHDNLEVDFVLDNLNDYYEFPKPVYSMRKLRPIGATKDSLVVTNAKVQVSWLLEPDAEDKLQLVHTFENFDAGYYGTSHYLEIADVTSMDGTAPPDLITVSKNSNTITVRRGTAFSLF